jgi:hypothetical protein|tara:strand:+ start:5413 stop:5688 length:276 start_codon:yes stop_codon:yes gene_type:complete
MSTQERDIVDLLWDNDQADALGKLKDMLQAKAAMAVDVSKQDVAARMFPHVPPEGDAKPDPEAIENPPETTASTEPPEEDSTNETDNGTKQ